MGKKNITFNDIAKYTGFSKTTVSRYFNNPDSLTLKNQQIISDALDKLNYQENKVARILANGKTEFIGVIIPNLYLHYYSEMLNQILKTYDTYGYKFLVFTGDDHKSTEREYIQELLSYKIEGMVILSHTIPSRELASYNLPIVTIEREDQFVSSVNTDNYMGAVQATSLLAKTGADILIHINVELSPQVPSYGRIKGFSDICEEYQITSKEQKEFSDMAVDKFQNRNIVDSIERNARDVDRKLGATERIMAPLAIVRKHDQSSPELLLTAASALYYGKMTKTLLKTEAEYIADLPEEWQKEIMEDLEALEQKKDIADILK